jgi:predicted DNA binding CopG/RHH family protein
MNKRKRPTVEKKPIPKFRDEVEERKSWETHDTTDYVDWSRGQVITFPNLRPSTTTISLRLPAPLLADLKALANKRDVPYQSLLKVFLAERVAAEQGRAKTLPSKHTQRTASSRPDRGAGAVRASKPSKPSGRRSKAARGL